MVKQNTDKIATEITKLNEFETTAVVRYISQLLSTRIPPINETVQPDDLIVTLADDYENLRARQVFEWETVRRQNIQRAA